MSRGTISHARFPAAAAGRWLLAGAIAGSALAVGTVHTVTLCVVATAVLGATVLTWWGTERVAARPAATLLLVTGVALTAYTGLQCVPLPIDLLAAIAPHNADVWSRALAPLHEAGPGWAPLTLDPQATRVEVLRGVVYLLTFVAVLRIARRREGVVFLSRTVVGTATILAAAALLHPAFGAHKLFGIYEPIQGSERHLAPLLNPNNLAEYLNVSICLALASVLAREPPIPRPIAAAFVIFLGATQLWVASRAGVVAMVLGVVLVTAFARLGHAREHRPVTGLSLIVGLGAAIGTIFIVLAGSDDASNELLVGDTSKLTMFFRMMRMMPSVPLFGCGRGAFESSFPAFRYDAGYTTFGYPENVVAQWVLEWGLPAATLGFAAVAIALRPGTALARSTAAGGAWVGLVVLAVQNLGDLGSEIPGIAIAGVACAGMVVAGTPGEPASSLHVRWALTQKRVAFGGGLAVAVAALAAGSGLGHELHDDQRTLYEAATVRRVSADELHAEARRAMLRHPAEPYLPFSVALRASQAHDENIVPWIGATLARARIYGPAHLLLARTLAKRVPSQARLEYRLAMEQTAELEGIALTEGTRIAQGYDDAMELVPSSPDAISVLEQISQASRTRLPATRVRLDAELARRVPSRPGPALRAAEDSVSDIEPEEDEPWCADAKRPHCLDEALGKAQRAEELEPDHCAPYALHARARAAGDDGERGLRELDAATDTVKDRIACLKELEALARTLKNEARVDTALEKIAAAGCTDDIECARTLAWIAQQDDERGYGSRAFAMYKRAYERTPEDEGLLESVATHAAKAGLHAEAADDYAKLALKRPDVERWRKAEAREREVALKAAAGL